MLRGDLRAFALLHGNQAIQAAAYFQRTGFIAGRVFRLKFGTKLGNSPFKIQHRSPPFACDPRTACGKTGNLP